MTEFNNFTLPGEDASDEDVAQFWAASGHTLNSRLLQLKNQARRYVEEHGENFGLKMEADVEWLPEAGSYYPNAIAHSTVTCKVVPGNDKAAAQRMVDQAFSLLVEELNAPQSEEDPTFDVAIVHKMDGRAMNKLMHATTDPEKLAQILGWRSNRPRMVVGK